jgi:hypothetical protein
MTATLQHEPTLDQLLGTVAETMTGEVVLLAADAPAVAAPTRHDVLCAVASQVKPRPSPVAARPAEPS